MIAFQPNRPHVIYENIEGELVLIHMAKGCYYSTDAIGAQLWEWIVAGHPVEDMHRWIGTSYEGDATEIGRALGDFFEELKREELIVPADDVATIGAPDPAVSSERPGFQAPVLSKYRDMEDMLMLDPIHEVEEAGWPAPKPAEKAQPPEPARAD